MKRTKLKDRKLPEYTKGEEIMNMVSHIVGGSIGVASFVLCVVFAAIHKDGYAIDDYTFKNVSSIFMAYQLSYYLLFLVFIMGLSLKLPS